MTGRATYGDFAADARRRLDALPGPGTGSRPMAGPAATVAGISAGVRAVVTVMARYAEDICAVFDAVPPPGRAGLASWVRAAGHAREALANAAGFLESAPDHLHGADPRSDWTRALSAGGMEAAAVAMALGRDLLHTHLDPRPREHPDGRSEWAPVIMSVPVARALLSLLGCWARQIAPHGCQAAVTAGRGAPQDRRDLSAACQWLWTLTWAVGAAQERDPVPDDQIRLLHAIPVNILPRRQLPTGGEPVTAVCAGIAATAERFRASARFAAARGRWSPGLTRESLRHTAGNCAITASNCGIVLRTLMSAPRRAGAISDVITEAHQATERARAAWLTATGAWDVISTDTRGAVSRSAADAADLALWTGRLAYTNPEWAPNLGPRHTARPAGDLAATAEILRAVITAVHHACHTVAEAAAAEQNQVRTAFLAGRLIVPTRCLPETFDIPYRIASAPAEIAYPLLTAYRDAETTSEQALADVAAIAERVSAPSTVLTTARIAAMTSPAGAVAASNQSRAMPAAPRPPQPVPPGPVERTLLDLDVTNPADLEQAAVIDKAAAQLILRTARAGPAAIRGTIDLSRSSGTAELISSLLGTSGDQTPAALRPPRAPGHDRPAAAACPPAGNVIRATLPASLIAARQARAAVRQALSEWGLDHLADDAELLASELVANAAEHGDGRPIRLALHLQAGPERQPGFRCEVTDTSPRLPRRRGAAPHRERGRGLSVVAALASASGVRASRAGKTAWFTLTEPGPSRSATRHADAEAEAGA